MYVNGAHKPVFPRGCKQQECLQIVEPREYLSTGVHHKNPPDINFVYTWWMNLWHYYPENLCTEIIILNFGTYARSGYTRLFLVRPAKTKPQDVGKE